MKLILAFCSMAVFFGSCGGNLKENTSHLAGIYDSMEMLLKVEKVSSDEYELKICSFQDNAQKVENCVGALKDDSEKPITFSLEELENSFSQERWEFLDRIMKIRAARDEADSSSERIMADKIAKEKWDFYRMRHRELLEVVVDLRFNNAFGRYADLKRVFEVWPGVMNATAHQEVEFVYPMLRDIAFYLSTVFGYYANESEKKRIEYFCLPSSSYDGERCEEVESRRF